MVKQEKHGVEYTRRGEESEYLRFECGVVFAMHMYLLYCPVS